jgi:signal transduction histidine kinase
MITVLFETLRRRTAQALEAERLARRSAADLIVSQECVLEAERAARVQAEQASRLKDELLAVASHELRTPLSAILGWTDILRRLPATDGRRDRALQAIHRNAEEEVRLLGDLMDVARLSSDAVRAQPAPIDIGMVVRTAWEIVEPVAQAKGIQPTIDLDPDLILRTPDAAFLRTSYHAPCDGTRSV